MPTTCTTPQTTLLDDIQRHVALDLQHACRSAQYEDLAGEDITAYNRLMAEIDHSIGVLKKFRRDVQSMNHHAHDWGDDDYCMICGADGRA